jgi:hypothetical protein
MDRQGELSIIRAAYAKQNLAAAGVVDNAHQRGPIRSSPQERLPPRTETMYPDDGRSHRNRGKRG